MRRGETRRPTITARALAVTARRALNELPRDTRAHRATHLTPRPGHHIHLPTTGTTMTQPRPQTDHWLTVTETIEYLGLSRATLYRALGNNAIPHTRDPITGRLRFQKSKLDAWMTKPTRRRS